MIIDKSIYYINIFLSQGIDSDIEEVTRPTDNLDALLAESMDNDTNGEGMLPIVSEDIATIPEEASEELRLEEEADALEAALASAKDTSACISNNAGGTDREKDTITVE